MPDVDPATTTVARDDLASPWQRLGAVFIDAVIVGFPFGVASGFWLAANDKSPGDYDPPWAWVMIPIWFVYEVVPTALWGKTIGKLLLDIRVCSRRDLGRPGWLRSLKRCGIYYVVGWIPFVGGFLALLIPLPLLWTANRQGFQDMFADTLVIREAPTHSPGNPDRAP